MSDTAAPTNLFDGLNDEIERVTELRRDFAELPGGAGQLAIIISIDPALADAKKARSDMDVVAMLSAYRNLKELTG